MKLNDKIIHNYLTRLGVSPAHKGYECISIALKLIEEDPRIKMTALYTIIAKKVDHTASAVERNIRHAHTRACNYGDVEFWNTIFGYNVRPYSGTTTNAEFLKGLYTYITIQEDSANE